MQIVLTISRLYGYFFRGAIVLKYIKKASTNFLIAIKKTQRGC